MTFGPLFSGPEKRPKNVIEKGAKRVSKWLPKWHRNAPQIHRFFSDHFPIVEKVTKSGPKDHFEGGHTTETPHKTNEILIISKMQLFMIWGPSG